VARRGATAREIGRTGYLTRVAAALAAIIAGSVATFGAASADHVMSTQALCAVGTGSNATTTAAPCTNGPNVVGDVAMLDSAFVTATSDRLVKFLLWAPGTCGATSKQPVFTETDPVGGSAALHTDTITTKGFFVATNVGMYAWQAEVLNSDMSVNSGPTPCSDEQVNIIKASPTLKTAPSSGGHVGQVLTDTATLTGGDMPSGTMAFRLFGPNDPGCTGTPLKTFADVAVSNERATTAGFTTSQAGVYHWTATYSGDANNNGAASQCGEAVTVTAPPPPPQSSGVASGVLGINTPGTGSDLSDALVLGGILMLLGGGVITVATRARGTASA
jgi:hypothetical protein